MTATPVGLKLKIGRAVKPDESYQQVCSIANCWCQNEVFGRGGSYCQLRNEYRAPQRNVAEHPAPPGHKRELLTRARLEPRWLGNGRSKKAAETTPIPCYR